MKIGIATCLTIPEPDVDEEITLQAFRDRGHTASLLYWDDPSENAADFDLVVVRSTWNYPLHADAFADWIRDTNAKTRLLNPADIMLGNLNKHYLTDLPVPTVPTQWILANDAEGLRQILDRKSVIKPTIGAGSFDTRSFEPKQIEEAIQWLGAMSPEREFMVQPYLESVHTVGEQSIIVIGDEPSHRILKHPRFADGEELVEGPFEVTDEFESIARRVIEPIKDRILYARVDLMLDDDGTWCLSELELIEPSLFFKQKPDALDRLVDRVELLTK